MMRFIGICFYLKLQDKGTTQVIGRKCMDNRFIVGEIKNYFTNKIDRTIFGQGNANPLQGIMALSRFWQLRRCFNFKYHAKGAAASSDPLFRIRPIVIAWPHVVFTTDIL